MAENINTYMGNANLAQGTAGTEGAYSLPSLTVTNDAVDKLMMYRFYENRDEWARNNVLADRAAEQAAKDLSFNIQDWAVPADREAVQKSIEEVTRLYAENPDAVTMRMDSSGKFINAEAYQKLHNAINKTNINIQRANARTQQVKLLDLQLGQITDADEYDKAKAYRDEQLKTGIDQSIPLFANIKVNDLHTVTGTPVNPQIQKPVGNYFINSQWEATDVRAGINQWKVQMQQSGSWNKDISSTINAWEQIRAGAVNSLAASGNNNPTPDDIRKAIEGQDGGADLLSFVDNNNNYAKFQKNITDTIPQSGLQPTQEIDLTKPLSTDEGLSMLITMNAQKGFKETQTVNEVPLEKERIAIQRFNAQTSREQLKLAREQFDAGKGNTQQQQNLLGTAMANYWGTLFAAPTVNGTQGVPWQQAQKTIQPEGVQMKAEDVLYKVSLDQYIQNALKRESGEKTTQRVLDPDTQQYVNQTVSAGDYKMKQAFVVLNPADNGDLNKGKIIIQYENPKTGSTFSQGYTKEQIIQLAPNMWDDGTGKGTQMAQAAALALAGNTLRTQPDFNIYKQGSSFSNAPAAAGAQPLPRNSDGSVNYGAMQSGVLYQMPDGTFRRAK